jgi:hypothetical protein
MSRAHFLRNFPLTSAFLEDAHNSGTHRLTQFLLHNVVARGTVNNMGAFYTGEPASHKTTVSETRNWLWKIMKDEGYATSFIVDTPRETDGDMPRWLVHPPHVDYVLSEPFSVVGHGPGSTAQPYQYALSGSRGRVCLGGKDVHRHAFGYHEAFHDLHRSIPRFSVNWNCAGHEDTMRVTGTYDFDLYTMLKRLYDSGILEDTAVLLLSDHGMKGVTFYETGIGETEYRMPLASLLLPRSVLADHPEYEANIRANQFRLTTHYDLHRTLWHLARFPDPPPPLNADYILAKNHPYVKWDPNPNNPPLRPSRETWPYARSLLEVTMPLNRSCAEAAVPPRWCHCASEMEVIDPKQRTARDLARRALAAIRAKLWGRGEGGGREGARGGGQTMRDGTQMGREGPEGGRQDSGVAVCARLTLAEVHSAEQWTAKVSHENNDASQARQYREVRWRVVFGTREPYESPAVWEASMDRKGVQHVSRLSAYAGETCDKGDNDQGLCVCCGGGKGGGSVGGGSVMVCESPDALNAGLNLTSTSTLEANPSTERGGVSVAASRVPPPSGGDIRLASDGLLELYWRGEWGAVCNDVLGPGFKNIYEPRESPFARVVCRQLGLTGGMVLPELAIADVYTLDVTPRRYSICEGTEQKLGDCVGREGDQQIHHQEVPNCIGQRLALHIECERGTGGDGGDI